MEIKKRKTNLSSALIGLHSSSYIKIRPRTVIMAFNPERKILRGQYRISSLLANCFFPLLVVFGFSPLLHIEKLKWLEREYNPIALAPDATFNDFPRSNDRVQSVIGTE